MTKVSYLEALVIFWDGCELSGYSCPIHVIQRLHDCVRLLDHLKMSWKFLFPLRIRRRRYLHCHRLSQLFCPSSSKVYQFRISFNKALILPNIGHEIVRYSCHLSNALRCMSFVVIPIPDIVRSFTHLISTFRHDSDCVLFTFFDFGMEWSLDLFFSARIEYCAKNTQSDDKLPGSRFHLHLRFPSIFL